MRKSTEISSSFNEVFINVFSWVVSQLPEQYHILSLSRELWESCKAYLALSPFPLPGSEAILWEHALRICRRALLCLESRFLLCSVVAYSEPKLPSKAVYTNPQPSTLPQGPEVGNGSMVQGFGSLSTTVTSKPNRVETLLISFERHIILSSQWPRALLSRRADRSLTAVRCRHY